MAEMLAIEVDCAVLQTGVPAERACFAAIGITHDNLWLTQAEDSLVNRLRDKAHLPTYRLAEWLARNWLRLRWEPPKRTGGASLSFALDGNATDSLVVFRSKRETGRRFELASLLGDRVAAGVRESFFPATGADTYRQKVQRSFVAKFLSPFEAVEEMLGADFSDENQIEVARHFNVSELTIRTLPVNRGLVGTDALIMEMDAAAV